MTIFSEPETLCDRQNNSCKRKNKCKRYLDERRDFQWEANYYSEFGQFCTWFIAKGKDAA